MNNIKCLSIIILMGFGTITHSQNYNNSDYGTWCEDNNNLPYFKLNFRNKTCPWYSFPHLQGTKYNVILTNQWGDVNLFTTDIGLNNISPSLWHTRGGFYPMMKVNDELVSLLFSELNSDKSIEYGIGYTNYSGIASGKNYKIKANYKIITPFDDTRGFYVQLTLENLSAHPIDIELSANSDVWIKPEYNKVKEWRKTFATSVDLSTKGIATLNIQSPLRNVALIGDESFNPNSNRTTLCLEKKMALQAQSSNTTNFKLTYNVSNFKKEQESLKSIENQYSTSWLKMLNPIKSLHQGNWMDRENIWTYSQLLSMCFFDKSLDEYFIHLGGYGIGIHPANPGTGFSMREVAETAIILSYFNPELARSSLRWMMKTQLFSGDMKRGHTHNELKRVDSKQVLGEQFPNESDTEIWFLIACGEYFKATKDTKFFSEKVPYRTINKEGTVWEHIKQTTEFISNDIGVGSNSLIRMLHGDWNDYLSRIGRLGNGQSLMNTAMMCRALIGITSISEIIEPKFTLHLNALYKQYKDAVDKGFDKKWFIRAVDDEGNKVGTHNDRLFINAQSWAALGKCGTKEQRKTALMNAVKHCSTPIGMTIISKPYSSPTPTNISWAPIPAGEGENAGIWPQTVAWMIWALAEEGLSNMALEEWKKCTLSQHSSLYPEIPFGIINGPDCYSSHFSNEREGWTQTAMFDRLIPIPMNPIIAWQAFSMKQILLNE